MRNPGVQNILVIGGFRYYSHGGSVTIKRNLH